MRGLGSASHSYGHTACDTAHAFTPWQVPVAALESEPLKIGVRHVIARRPLNSTVLQENRTLKLPGFLKELA